MSVEDLSDTLLQIKVCTLLTTVRTAFKHKCICF